MIVHALKMWRHYLLGRKFMLTSNHGGLRYFFEQPNLNSRQSSWLYLIGELNFEIRHIKGKENKVENVLSISLRVEHLETMRTYEFDIKEKIKEVVR